MGVLNCLVLLIFDAVGNRSAEHGVDDFIAGGVIGSVGDALFDVVDRFFSVWSVVDFGDDFFDEVGIHEFDDGGVNLSLGNRFAGFDFFDLLG